MHETAQAPRKLNASLPERYDEIFARALAKEPEKRYASATGFSAALDIRDLELSIDDLVDDQPREEIRPALDAAATAWRPSTPDMAEVAHETMTESPTLAAPAPPVGARPTVRRGFWFGLAAVVALGAALFVIPRSGIGALETTRRRPARRSPLEGSERTEDIAPSPTAKKAVRSRAPAAPRQATVAATPVEHTGAQVTTPGQLVELGPDVAPPRRIEGSSSSYPAAARRRDQAGTVTVRMIITEEGEPIDVTIVESAGAILDAAVLDAIEGWRFEPATKDGVKVRVRWVIRQTFRLKS